ncbi:MAG: NAD(P)/FAD-dependent oxidoreductase [Gemmatimonadaceae bacterium]
MESDVPEQQFEVGIIGGGPAGLSAAIWCARYLHSVALIDAGDPRNWETRGVNGLLGLDGIQPPELRKRGRATCRELGVELFDEEVLLAERRRDEDFLISLRGGRRVAVKRLLLAIGIRDIWPRIPGVRHAYGTNALVCPDCDGYEARDKKVVVIGHGRRAVGMALNLTTWTKDIVICTNGRTPDLDLPEYCQKLNALNIRVLTDEITNVVCGDDEIHCLVLADGTQLAVDKLFFTIGQYPSDDLGVQLGCDRDDEGHIIIDDHGLTSTANVYAAGDITPGAQIVPRAEATGVVAAMAIHKSLVPPGRSLTPLAEKSATSSR